MEEQNLLNYHDCMEKISDRKYASISITFQVTDACNLNCSYCYQHNKGNHVMTFDIAKKFIDMLLSNDKKIKHYINTEDYYSVILEFIGGEPFLQIDLIDKITTYFIKEVYRLNHHWKNTFIISICSNGTLYNSPKVQEYMHKQACRKNFMVTVDGDKTLHDSCRVFPNGEGSYDLAIKAVHDYEQEFHNKMSSKITIAPENIHYLNTAIQHFVKEEYVDINANCVFEDVWDNNTHPNILYNQLKQVADYLIDNDLKDKIFFSMFVPYIGKPKSNDDDQNWCGGNGRMLAIDWKGDFYPCLRYMESSLGNNVKPYIIGNVKKGIGRTFRTKWKIKKLKAVNRITQSSDECIACPIADGCAYCQAFNYESSGGNINKRATYTCQMHKARVLANAYYWNKLYQKYNEPKRFKIWLPKEEALKIITEQDWEELKKLEYPIGQ